MSNFVVTDRVEVELAAIVKALAVDRVFVLVDENTAECCLPILRHEMRDTRCEKGDEGCVMEGAKVVTIKATLPSKPGKRPLKC